jgi:hypothetical protein
MAIESNSSFTISDPSRVASDLNDVVRPGMQALGALEVTGAVAMTGPVTGMGVVSTRWESMDQWAAADAAGADPDSDMAELAARYQITQRIISQDLHEAGNASGSFLNASRYSFAGPPPGLENAANLAVSAGANGLRIVRVLAGGDMTGHVIGAMFLDSLEALPDILASITSDAQFVADVQSAGGKLESRTIFRTVR